MILAQRVLQTFLGIVKEAASTGGILDSEHSFLLLLGQAKATYLAGSVQTTYSRNLTVLLSGKPAALAELNPELKVLFFLCW